MTPTCAAPDGRCHDLALEGLGLRYGSTWAFRGLDLRLPSCAITAIVGPSGCGKSSLLTCINRLDELEPIARREGRVTWGGRDLHAAGSDVVDLRRRIGMLFQNGALWSSMTVLENAMLPMDLYSALAPEEKPAYAVSGPWLLLAAQAGSLKLLLSRAAGDVETCWRKAVVESAPLWAWGDFGLGNDVLRLAFSAYAFKLMLEDAAGSQPRTSSTVPASTRER